TGASVSDTNVGSGPDVFVNYDSSIGQYIENGGVSITEPVHGLGNVTVTTAGGTSAPLTLNELDPGVGYIRDIGIVTANNQLWVADNGSPAKLNLVSITTGQTIRSIPATAVSSATNAIGNTSFFGAIQVLPSAMTLNGVSVAAGSLLAFYGPSNPDYV